MKIVFHLVGERKSCITISNLGRVELPEAMKPYVSRMDFILGPQATCKNNCGILSYGNDLYISLLRTIRETELEREFLTALKRMGLSEEELEGLSNEMLEAFNGMENVVSSITVQDVQDFMKRLLDQGNYRVVILDPEVAQ